MTGRPKDMAEFLAQLDMQHLHDTLAAEDVDMTVLPLLSDDDLKSLGLNLGQRKRLLQALDAINATVSDTALSDSRIVQNPVQLRRLSVLFCDMVGSTELGERLTIDEMQSVLQQYYDTANRVAARHNGHVAASQGDGLVILFGYPRVLEGIAERCISAARDLQRALSETPVRIDGQDPVFITTRIGIASGQAAVGLKHNDVSGDHMHLVGPVVNRAARLQTVARPHGCAVDVRTRELTEHTVSYENAELHRLKGMSDPVEVYHVLGTRHGAVTPTSVVPVIGRAAETDRLSRLWHEAQGGRARTCTIIGDAGIGKTALVQNFLANHVSSPVRIIRMECSSMAAQSPLRPVANALSALTQASDAPQTLASLLNNSAPDMTARVAQFLEMTGSPNADAAITASDREAILDLLAGWIVNGSGDPTIAVLENAQWADDTTREFMKRAAARAHAERAPLLMLAVTRDESADLWSDLPEHDTLILPPLNGSDASDVLHSVLEQTPVPQSVKDNILYHADGNPLMLGTLGHAQVRHLVPEVADSVFVPHTIYESVSKRLDTIRSGRRVIEALAVLGAPASRDVLSNVLRSDAQALEPALDALEQAGLVDRQGPHAQETIAIRHKAYRDVIYEQIDGSIRKDMHAAAFVALLETRGIRPEVLASHAQAAQDWVNTSKYALDAGEAFLKRSALVEAGHYLDMADAALRRVPASPSVNRDRLRAVTGLASVERARFGIATDRSAELGQLAAELARDTGDQKAELLALNGLYSHALVRSDYPKADNYATALLAAAELNQNKTFVMIGTRAKGAVALHRGDQVTAVHSLSEALAQYDRDAHLPLAHAHGYDHAEICAALLSMSLWISGDLERARHFSAFSITHSKDIDHAHSLAQAMSFRVMLGALARHGSELDEVGAEGAKVAETFGISVMRAACRLFPFATRLCLNAAAPTQQDMADLALRVEEFRAVNPFNYGPLLASVLAEVYLRADDLTAADAVLEDGMETGRKTGETWTSCELMRMRARLAAARGDGKDAARLRRDALERAHRTHAATIALRIACDTVEAAPDPASIAALRDALSGLSSRDRGWDILRAEALLRAVAGH